jgi:hypothetical protein
MGVSAIAVGNWSTLKSTEISQVNDKLYNIMLNRVHPEPNGIQIHSLSGDMHWLHK